MNYRMIGYICGKILMIEAGLMLAPLLISLIYRETLNYQMSWLLPLVALFLLGYLLSCRKPANLHIFAREGCIIVALSWILLSVGGAIPLILNGDIPNVVDAIFEMASGFTTTGASICRNVEVLSHSVLFWRSETHLVGGMGVLVFALAVMPGIDSSTVHLMKAEVPGPVFGKIVARIRNTAQLLYKIYFSLTILLIGLLLLGGMNLFDACIHAFGTAGTGGFSNYVASVGHYHNLYFEIVIGIFMLIFGINFNLFFFILIGQVRKALKSEELLTYLAIVTLNVLLIAASLYPQVLNVGESLRQAFFSVSSIITTTGYATADFASWPLFAQMLLLLLMFLGACAGSTGGGFKVSRLIILCKASLHQLRNIREPNRIQVIRMDGRTINKDDVAQVRNYLAVYLFMFIAFTLLITLDTPDFLSAVSSVAATFNNIGPGLGVFGPSYSFADASYFSKVIYSLAMIAGRLEIYPMLILLSPRTYLRR